LTRWGWLRKKHDWFEQFCLQLDYLQKPSTQLWLQQVEFIMQAAPFGLGSAAARQAGRQQQQFST
jgi:hypothetical protein